MVPPPLLRRLRLTLLALALCLVALAGRLVAIRSADATVPGRHLAQTIPFTDVHPYGANFLLEHEVEPWKLTKTVEMAEAAGLRWAKQHFPWSDIEPNPGEYSWDKYDRLVDLYRDHGLEVIARLDWPPRWVQPASWVATDKLGTINAPPANVGAYADFVAATVRHFQGRVRFYQIWNEPNLRAEWGDNPQHPVDPAEYAALLAAASAAARAVDPNVVILTAPLAVNLESPALAGNMNDLDYLDGLYRAGAGPYFDVVGASAYGMDRPPEDRPAAGVLNFRRMELQRAVMERHGDQLTPIWLTEFGWNAAPEGLYSVWGRVPEERQAEWTVAGVRWAEAHWPWAGVFGVWYFRDWGDRHPDQADYYFRMVDVDFSPRRVYDAVRAASAGLAEAGPGAWAEWSSPVHLERLDDWSWQWRDGAEDGNALVAQRAGARVALPFRGHGVTARVWTAPDGGELAVAVDGVPARGNGSGPRVSLRSAATGWQEVPLVTGLAEGRHDLVLTTVGEGTVVIDGYYVAAAEAAGSPDAGLVALAALAGTLALLGVVDFRRVSARIRL